MFPIHPRLLPSSSSYSPILSCLLKTRLHQCGGPKKNPSPTRTGNKLLHSSSSEHQILSSEHSFNNAKRTWKHALSGVCIPSSCPDHLQLVARHNWEKRGKRHNTERMLLLTRLGVFLLSFSRFTSGNVPRRLHTFRSSFFHRCSFDSA